MVMDHYHDRWKTPQYLNPLPDNRPLPLTPLPGIGQFTPAPLVPPITKEEIEEFRKLLDRAREYDKKNNEPDCELEWKKERLLKLAKELGINIEFIK